MSYPNGPWTGWDTVRLCVTMGVALSISTVLFAGMCIIMPHKVWESIQFIRGKKT